MITTRLALLGALLVPAAALAQPADPDAPPPPPPVVVPAPVTTQAPTVVVEPPPPAPVVHEYEEIEDPYNAPMFFSGALVFGASYGASVITAATSDDTRGNHRLYVPLAGPWLALSDRGSCDITRESCDHETTAKVLLVADGVFQAAGVLAMLDSLFQPSTHRVITSTAKLDTEVHVTPTTVHGDPGVAVFGHW